MNARQHLVEQWKAKLAANLQQSEARVGHFTWARRVYARIYRFLVSRYGDGEWRAGDDNSSAGIVSTDSRMPFVESGSTTDGLLPKSPERIRAALDSIHSSNSGLSAPGTMNKVADETWVVVAASTQRKAIWRMRTLLRVAEIEHRSVNRTTDITIETRHANFEKAIEVLHRKSASEESPTPIIQLNRDVKYNGVVSAVFLVAVLSAEFAIVNMFLSGASWVDLCVLLAATVVITVAGYLLGRTG